MTTKSAAEIATIVDEIEQPFQLLWERNDSIERYLEGLWSAADELPETLDSLEQLATLDPIWDYNVYRNKLNKPIELRITPHSPNKKDRQRADRIEDFEANRLVKMGLQNGGWQYDTLCSRILTDVFVPMWLEFDQYELPKRGRRESAEDYRLRREQYAREWWGVRPVFDPVRTTAFMDRDRVITAATRRYRIPVVDLLRYAPDYDIDYDPERPAGDAYQTRLEIVGQHFDYLRGADNESPDGMDPSMYSQWVDVKEVHEGATITHCIRTNSISSSGEHLWQELGQYDNPLGRPALFIATGLYGSGKPLHRRYQPGMIALWQAYKNRDRLRSYMLSLMASAKKNKIILDSESITAWSNLTPESRRSFIASTEEDDFSFLPGVPTDTTTIEHQWELAQNLLQSVESDVQRMRPSAALTNNPDQAAAVGATATTILTLAEEQDIPLQGMQTEITNVIKQVLESIQTMFITSINSHYDGRPDDERDEDELELDAYFYAITDGREWVAGRETEEGGAVTIKPEDYAMGFTRSLASLDLSLSTMTARRQEADARWFTADGIPTISWDKRLEEHGERNVTKAKRALWSDRIFQKEVPRLDAMIASACERYAEVLLGMQRGMLGQMEQPPERALPAGGAPPGGPGDVRHTVSLPARMRPQGTATTVTA